jgi:hypothetical protein
MYPDESAISLPPNPNVPKDFPGEAWYNSGEMRSYNDQGAAFAAAGFTVRLTTLCSPSSVFVATAGGGGG